MPSIIIKHIQCDLKITLHLQSQDLGFITCVTLGKTFNYSFKYILSIMLLQLSHFFSPLFPSALYPPPTSTFPPLSSCPGVIHRSFLASTFPILFLNSPCLFCTYHFFYLFSALFPPLSPSHFPTDNPLHMISISVILFLF